MRGYIISSAHFLDACNIQRGHWLSTRQYGMAFLRAKRFMARRDGCPRFEYVQIACAGYQQDEFYMKARRFLLCFCTTLSFLYCAAQNPEVLNRLNGKYEHVEYSPEGGGWYLVSYQAGTKTLMGFCNKNGAMICSNVEKVEKHKSWINLCVLDAEKKRDHDRWEDDMRVYKRDLDYYNKVEAQYNATLKNYNNQVAAAKAEANRRWQNARAIAEKNAQAKQQSSSSGGGIFGAILQGVTNAAAVNAAVEAVEYKPFEDQVISERGLFSAPVKPDNPEPTMPSEPASGYEWKPFTYVQPCPFDTIFFESIKDDNGYAIAKKNGKYGVVDCDLKNTVPFKYDELKEKKESFECRKGKLWGVVTSDGNEKFPCMFTAINLIEMNGKDVLLTNINGKCGAADFETAKALVPNIYSTIQVVALTDKETAFKVKKESSFGVYAADGKMILDAKYPDLNFIHITNSKNFYITAKSNTNVGLFDTKGNELVPYEKCSKYEFLKNSFIKLYTPSGIQGVVGLDGSPIADIAYSNIAWDETLNGFIVTQYDKMGAMTSSGELLFPMVQCESLACIGDYFLFKNGIEAKSFGALDYKGQIIVEPQYAADRVGKRVDKSRKKFPSISSAYSESTNVLKNSFAAAAEKFIKE